MLREEPQHDHAHAGAGIAHDERLLGELREKNSLTRLVENSTTNRVLELTSVPIEVISGNSVSRWERYGIPAGLGTAIALLLAAAAD